LNIDGAIAYFSEQRDAAQDGSRAAFSLPQHRLLRYYGCLLSFDVCHYAT